MDQRRKRIRPKLITPCIPQERSREFFINSSSDVKIVSDYTSLNFNEVYDMDIFSYYGYLHDAVVWNCSKTNAGKDYLESAYNHSQTEPDRDKLNKCRENGLIGGRHG